MARKLPVKYAVSIAALGLALPLTAFAAEAPTTTPEDATAQPSVSEAQDTDTSASSAQTPSGPAVGDAGTRSGMRGGNGGRMGGGNGGGMAANDPDVQAVIDANASKFQQLTYTDPGTGFELSYSLYVPADYDESTSYPLVMFIPDSTGAGKSAQQIVEQYYGADVWVTDESQEENPCFVLVPAFTETVVDDNWNVSDQVDVAVNLLDDLQQTYSIDADRLYTTGQSMGCMTSLYLNATHPDLFAASIYVSGQWDPSVLEPLEEQTFFYITAGGDTKASGGQDEVMAMFDDAGIPYTYGTWSAQDSEEEQDAAVDDMIDRGCDANFIRFETGTVFADGQTGMEHMASFNYAYKLGAVRDWLFEQSK